MATPSNIIVDAGALLDLAATRRVLDIVDGLGLTPIGVHEVEQQITHFAGSEVGQSYAVRAEVDLMPLFEKGRFVWEWFPSAEESFVRAAEELADQDARALAGAATTGYPLWTNQRRTREVAARLFPSVKLESSLGVLRRASETLKWTRAETRKVLADLHEFGAFEAPSWDPERSWMQGVLQRSR